MNGMVLSAVASSRPFVARPPACRQLQRRSVALVQARAGGDDSQDARMAWPRALPAFLAAAAVASPAVIPTPTAIASVLDSPTLASFVAGSKDALATAPLADFALPSAPDLGDFKMPEGMKDIDIGGVQDRFKDMIKKKEVTGDDIIRAEAEAAERLARCQTEQCREMVGMTNAKKIAQMKGEPVPNFKRDKSERQARRQAEADREAAEIARAATQRREIERAQMQRLREDAAKEEAARAAAEAEREQAELGSLKSQERAKEIAKQEESLEEANRREKQEAERAAAAAASQQKQEAASQEMAAREEEASKAAAAQQEAAARAVAAAKQKQEAASQEAAAREEAARRERMLLEASRAKRAAANPSSSSSYTAATKTQAQPKETTPIPGIAGFIALFYIKTAGVLAALVAGYNVAIKKTTDRDAIIAGVKDTVDQISVPAGAGYIFALVTGAAVVDWVANFPGLNLILAPAIQAVGLLAGGATTLRYFTGKSKGASTWQSAIDEIDAALPNNLPKLKK